MITVTQVQQEAIAAEMNKRRQAGRTGAAAHQDPVQAGKREPAGTLPSVPSPADEHVASARRVLGHGYQASVADRVDASRILDAAGLSADDFHGGKEPDSAPPGARDVAAAHLAREQAMADRTARKSYADRFAEVGPGEGVQPGHPQPDQFDRGYLEAGHASPSPQAEPARTNPNPAPSQARGYPMTIALSSQVRAAQIPHHVAATLSMGSPSER